MTANPQQVAQYLQNIATQATSAAYDHLQARIITNGHTMPPMRSLALTVDACGRTMQQIDLVAISLSLGHQRAIAVDGRPRGDSAGPRAKGGVSRPTESAADELARIKDIGLDLAEALNRVHPDPAWPAIESGRRARLRVATEVLVEAYDDAWGTLSPVQALDDLANAVENLHINVKEAAFCALKAKRCRAWPKRGIFAADVDPPDPVLEAMRCDAWWLGTDKDGNPIRCGQWASEHHTETGSVYPGRLCDDHWMQLCQSCHGAPRRTPGAKDCTTCSVRASRQRKAAA